MKILREGKAVNIYFVGKCYSCCCIIKVHKKELSSYQSGSYTADYELYGVFVCPISQCDRNITCYPIEPKTGQRILKSV
jgi:hypothetical protein